MRLGKVLTFVFSLIIASGLLTFGYIWYRENQVASFKSLLLSSAPSTFDSALVLLRDAPDATCVARDSNFQDARTVQSLHYQGSARFDFTYITEGNRVIHQIINSEGLYVWENSSSAISFIPMSLLRTTEFPLLSGNEASIFHASDCSVWWSPDKRFFEPPSSKPIVEYRGDIIPL